jgi:hypothetical protein
LQAGELRVRGVSSGGGIAGVRIPIKHPETIELARFFESVVFPRCTAVICDRDMRIQAVEMSDTDYFWMWVGVYSHDRDDREEYDAEGTA